LDTTHFEQSEKDARDNIEDIRFFNAPAKIEYSDLSLQLAASVLTLNLSAYSLPKPDLFNTLLQTHKPSPYSQLNRTHFTCLDAIYDDSSDSKVTQCSLDREFSIIVKDIAPYVRAIASHDHEIEQQNVRLALALSGGGKRKIRMSRASRSAIEGGRREDRRRERWFPNVNLLQIGETGSSEWAPSRSEETDGTESIKEDTPMLDGLAEGSL
jgi:hypothetical protein